MSQELLDPEDTSSSRRRWGAVGFSALCVCFASSHPHHFISLTKQAKLAVFSCRFLHFFTLGCCFDWLRCLRAISELCWFPYDHVKPPIPVKALKLPPVPKVLQSLALHSRGEAEHRGVHALILP